MTQPVVSVIVPILNAASTLGQQLEALALRPDCLILNQILRVTRNRIGNVSKRAIAMHNKEINRPRT